MTATLNKGGELRWRCRRGMLELDLLLEAFVSRELDELDADELNVFDRLLDYPDQVLYELCLKQTVSADKEIDQLVQRIRNAVRQPAIA